MQVRMWTYIRVAFANDFSCMDSQLLVLSWTNTIRKHASQFDCTAVCQAIHVSAYSLTTRATELRAFLLG